MQFPAAFGKYELLERIATGGMAEVFAARSFGVAGFEKRLVIKRIRPEFAQDPRFISLFINEAKIGVHLNHPNVVQVYDLGRVGSSWYMAMEHLKGRDLTRLVKTLRASEQKMPLPVLVAIVAKACRGLAYAHSRTDSRGNLLGLVHRDVSPHNLMVTFDGEVKLVDFGVARLMNTAEAKAERLAPGRPGGGKYAYMSPEQARGDVVDHRTDIFSAGIVLWELISGHRLFQTKDQAEKLRRVQEAVVPDPRDEGNKIDDALWTILRKALAREASERYASAALFEEDLRAWLFHRGEMAGRNEIAAQMRAAFPSEAGRTGEDIDLARMVADLDRLDAPEPTLASHPTNITPPDGTSALPGRLRASSDGERKFVAVLVIDIDGLTDLSSRVEPEMLWKRHYQLLRWFRRHVDPYKGIITSAVDDHVVALFGVPRTRDDDLARALECALELHRTVNEVRDKGINVSLAIGVHAGEVTVGRRNARRIKYVARGNTTRLARRLSAVADHGEILVSERVLEATEGRFRLKRGADVPNRGGRAPTPGYHVIERRRGLRATGKGPWLRRGNELDVIRRALVGLGHGTGAVIVLTGGAGTGKSRLVREIRDRAHRRGLPFYLARCTPFGEDPPMEPFRDIIREVLGVEHDTPHAAIVRQLPRLTQLGLSQLHIDAAGGLLGVGQEVSARDTTWNAVRAIVRGLPREGPVIVALEDIGHLRQAELIQLQQMVRIALDQPVVFLMTARGQAQTEFAGQQIVALDRFGAKAQHRLLRNLLEVRFVAASLVSLVDRTCEGNPLYLEQMVKYLVQSGRLRIDKGRAELVDENASVDIPDSMAGLIAARIDALDPASKGALQLAAIIGLTFSAQLLGEAAGLDDPTPLVSDLASHGLIVRTDGGGDDWAFGSELIQEAALRGILGVQRRDYHRMVAAAIETIHQGATEGWAESLATHCAEGGRLIDAARFAHIAAQRLEREQYLERAREILVRGLAWIRAVPESPSTWDARVQGEAMLNFRYGATSLLLGDSVAGARALHVAVDIASDCALPWIEVRAHVELGRSYLHRGRMVLARAHLDLAHDLLVLDRDPELELETLEASAVLAFEEGKNEAAEDLWHDALALAKGTPAAEARCLLGLANRYLRSGENDQAAPLLNRALEAARRAGDRILEGRVLNNVGLLHSTVGDHEDAIVWFREALQVREGIGYTRGVAINHHNIGDAHFNMGHWAKAWVAFERSRELAIEMGWDRGTVLNDVYMGYIDAVNGDPVSGLAKIEEATQTAERIGDSSISTTGLWLSGKWLLEHGEASSGKERLEAALQEARAYGLQPMVQAVEEVLAELNHRRPD